MYARETCFGIDAYVGMSNVCKLKHEANALSIITTTEVDKVRSTRA